MAQLAYFEGHPERIHVMDRTGGGEYTACGMAFDIASEEPHLGELIEIPRGRVTCAQCAASIEHFRGVRLAPPDRRVSDDDLDS